MVEIPTCRVGKFTCNQILEAFLHSPRQLQKLNHLVAIFVSLKVYCMPCAIATFYGSKCSLSGNVKIQQDFPFSSGSLTLGLQQLWDSLCCLPKKEVQLQLYYSYTLLYIAKGTLCLDFGSLCCNNTAKPINRLSHLDVQYNGLVWGPQSYYHCQL